MSKDKKIVRNLAEIIDSYRENYFRKVSKYPSAIPLSTHEWEQMVSIIRKYVTENSDQTTYYFEDGETEEVILVWRQADLYIHPNAAEIRKSIQK